MKRTIPTVIVEPRTLLREGIAALLKHTSYHVVATAASISALLRSAIEPPALTLIGFSGDATEATSSIQDLRRGLPASKIIVVAESWNSYGFQELVTSGADGCILNIRSQAVLLKSLDLVMAQQRVLVLGDANMMDEVPQGEVSSIPTLEHMDQASVVIEQLSPRERQILRCLIRGESNKTIARTCNITEGTVKVHLKTILRKIRVENRTQAAIWAIDHGFALDRPGELDDAMLRLKYFRAMIESH